MASPKTLARVESLTWILIFGGMFTVVLGIVTGDVHFKTGWSFGVLGGIAVAVGIALVYVRSRMTEDPAAGAQSTTNTQGKQ